MSATTFRNSLVPAVRRLPFWRTSFGQWLKAKLGIGRLWGLRYRRGSVERTGFSYRRQALAWAEEHCPNDYVVFMYEPVDMRILPSAEHQPEHYSGYPEAR